MAKDGTNRGGRRVRAGDKPDALADKIINGRTARIMEFEMPELEGAEFEEPPEICGEEMPNPSEYLSARQRDGKPLGADEIFKETWLWLKERGCEKLVNPRLIESYSQAFARFIQCEDTGSSASIRQPAARYRVLSYRCRRRFRNRQICCGMKFSTS